MGSLTDGWDCVNRLPELEFVEDSGLPGGVEPKHNDSFVQIGELIHDARDKKSHVYLRET